MTLEREDRPGGLRLLRADGELDAFTVRPLLTDLPGLVSGARAVVLDLSAVSFFDSSGVRLVDRLARLCAAEPAPLRLVAPAGTPPRRVLEIVGLADDRVHDDVPSACAGLGAAG